MPDAYRRRVPPDVLAAITAANETATLRRHQTRCRGAGAVLRPARRRRAGSAAGRRPAGHGACLDAAKPFRSGRVPGRGCRTRRTTARSARPCAEAREETGVDTNRLSPLAVLDRMFIPPTGFHVVPVLAYSPDPGRCGWWTRTEAAIVARVPLRAFINPENRLMVYREANTSRFAGPAFLLNQMLVWGFTGQVISAILDVAGWAQPWDTDDVRELDEAMALVGRVSQYREAQQ